MAKKSNLGNSGKLYCHFYKSDAAPSPWSTAFASASRARDFYNSRQALLLSLQALSPNYSNLTIDQLDIVDYLHLKVAPHVKVSISHTKNYAAALVSDCPQVQSVGIDIELTSRVIKDGVLGYIAHQLDFAHQPLALWTIKEACFKAAAPLFQHTKSTPLVLKDFWVKEDQFGLFDSEQIIGRFSLNIVSHYDEEFWVAKAWVE